MAGVWKNSDPIGVLNGSRQIGARTMVEQNSDFKKTLDSFRSKNEMDVGLFLLNNNRPITSDMLEKVASLFGVTTDGATIKTIPTNGILFAIKASDITEEVLETIYAINRIALNSNFLTRALEDDQCQE